MPRKIPDSELIAIETAVRQHAQGAQLATISMAFPGLAKRTLQARLKNLVESGRLRRKGDRKAARYFLPVEQPPSPIKEPALSLRDDDAGPPLPLISEMGREIRQLLLRPAEIRPSAGYDRSFLDDYEANKTFYLSETQRQHLATIGRNDHAPTAAGTYARGILERLLIELSWNSSRLEGNTYSLLETERLIELGHSADGRNTRESVMILNHKAAIEFLVDNIDAVGFDPRTILNLHAILSSDLLADPTASGRLRRIPVGIGGSSFEPLSGPQIIEECFDLLLAKAAAITDPFEQSFFVMVHLPYLQPFDDVNKRVSRLAANIPLIKGNWAPISFADVPSETYVMGLLGVYELKRVALLRDVFVWAYARSASRYAAQRQSMGEPDPFRLRHRDFLQDLIGNVIRDRLPRQLAAGRIQKKASEHIAAAERAPFIEMAEAELIGVRETNFARYRVKPSEYYAWRQAWDQDT